MDAPTTTAAPTTTTAPQQPVQPVETTEQTPATRTVPTRLAPERAGRLGTQQIARAATEQLRATRQASQQAAPEPTPEPAQVETTAALQPKPPSPAVPPATPDAQKLDPATERYRQEVAQLQQRVEQYERGEVATQAQRAALAEFRQTAEYMRHVRQYEAIRQAEEYGDVSEGAAADYWSEVSARAQQYIQQRTAQALGEYDASVAEQREAVAFRESFVTEARRMSEVVPAAIRALPQYGQWFDHAVQTLDDLAERGELAYIERIADPSRRLDELHALFQQVLHRQLIARPEVQALRPRAKPASQPKPAPAAVPASPAPTRTPASALRHVPPSQLERQARQSARALARQYFGA